LLPYHGAMIWLRSIAFNLWFYGVTVLVALLSLPVLLLHPRAARWVTRFWARLVLGGLRPICGISVVVTGRENLPLQGPALIASQHQSAFDTIIWFLLVPEAAYVLKKELGAIPIYGALSRKMGMIAVDRAAGAAAIRTLVKDAHRAVAAGQQIVIFPEGTRAAPGVVLPLHPGVAALASRTALPVIPVVTDSGSCWGRRAFRKMPGTIRVAILPPLPAGLPRAELMARLAALFAAPIPVDNSVGAAPAGFTDESRKAG
jgi:1-acyl-sn-glycerol-3-phosphate acyltransferase